jgi:hypothetical protein
MAPQAFYRYKQQVGVADLDRTGIANVRGLERKVIHGNNRVSLPAMNDVGLFFSRHKFSFLKPEKYLLNLDPDRRVVSSEDP